MNKLVNINGVQVADIIEGKTAISSLDVAKMVGREHKNVIQDLRKIKEQLGELDIQPSYFIESEYINSQNKKQPCFLLSKKGCELYATRMTGVKGTLFAVQYIELFNKMEEQLKSQSTIPSYKIEDEITRAERWIEEEKQRRALVFKNEAMKPKVEFYEKVMSSENVLTTTQIAKELGTYASKLNNALHELGVQYKVGGQWVLYSPYQDKGYTKSVTSLDPQGKHGIPEDAAHVYTKWTHKGRQFIHELIKEKGITFK